LALLIHRGVAAWMNACSAATAEPPQAQPTLSVASSASSESTRQSPVVLPGVTRQVAHILAQMIFQTRQEA